MAKRILIRRDTSTNWVNNNPMLYPGEIGIETDTLKMKVGPSVVSPAVGTAWNSITNYLNTTPSNLNTTLQDYVLISDIGSASGVAGLDGLQNLLIPNDSIIFEGATADSYQLTLQATDPTADRELILPDVNGTIVTTGDTGTVTNTMLAGSIANEKLTNSSVTINGYEIELGSSASYGTDNINEGTSNLYFTNERAQDAVASAISAGTHSNITITYDDSANTLSFAAENGVADSTTDNLTEGSTNLYFTDERAQDAAAQALANGTHTNISVSYNDASNAISLTGAVTYTDENARDAVAGMITNSTHSGISVAYTDDSSNEGTLAFTNTGVTSISGTSNQIEASGSTGSITLSLPSAVTFPGTVTLNSDPTQALHAVTKQYVDGIAAGLSWKPAVNLLAATNISLTGNTNTLVIDSHDALVQADSGVYRLLLTGQSTGSENGIYVYNDNGTTYTLSRASDADSYTELDGASVFVMEGTIYGSTSWVQTNHYLTSFSGQTWDQFSGAGTYVAGNGLALTGSSFAIDTDVTVDVSSTQTLTNKTITGSFTGNLTGNADTATNGVVTTGTYSNPSWITSLDWSKISSTPTTISGYGITDGVVTSGTYSNPSWITGLAWSKISSTPTTVSGYGITDAVVTGGSYSDPSWLTISKSFVGLGNVENTALSTWAGTYNITTLGTITTGTWSADTIALNKGGTGATTQSGAANAILPSQTSANGKYLTSDGTNVSWATVDALPSQTGNGGKYLTTDGSTASWASLVVPITTGTATISSNTATTIDTFSMSTYRSVEYLVSLKQGSKIRTSKIIVQTDGTNVDMTEYGITETGGTMSGVVISTSSSGGIPAWDAFLQVTVTDASSTNVTVKFSKVAL